MQPTDSDPGLCPICGADLKPIYENNGYAEPDPTHYEITAYEPCYNCIDEPED